MLAWTLVKLNDYAEFLDSVEFPDDNEDRRYVARRWCVARSEVRSRIRKEGKLSMSRFAASLVVLTLVSCLLGCHVIETPYVPSGHRGGWDPVLGSCQTCSTCGGDCEGHTPGSYLGHKLACTSGCGEIYWGPWLSDPPADCDPCDDCGNFVGERCCPPKFRHRLLAGLAGGYACDCGGKGCASCSKGGGDVIYEQAPTDTDIFEVLPPTPDPIQPASLEVGERSAERPPFGFRSVRFER